MFRRDHLLRLPPVQRVLLLVYFVRPAFVHRQQRDLCLMAWRRPIPVRNLPGPGLRAAGSWARVTRRAGKLPDASGSCQPSGTSSSRADGWGEGLLVALLVDGPWMSAPHDARSSADVSMQGGSGAQNTPLSPHISSVSADPPLPPVVVLGRGT